MVNKEDIAWCLPCNECHGEWECPRNQVRDGREGPDNCECMNLVEDMDHIYAFHGKTYSITSEQLEKINHKSRDDARIARLEVLNAMDEESKAKIRKQKYIQYYRRNKALAAPQNNDSQPTPKLINDHLLLNIDPTPP